MARSDADTVRRAFEAWNEEGAEAVVERFWTEDAIYREMPGWSDAGVFRGRDAVLGRLRSLVELVGPIEVRLENVIEAEDGSIVAIAQVVGEAAEATTSYTQSFAVVHRLREGRIAEADYYLDPVQALDATRVGGG
jgi:ketosteroid isomerase-like protein